MCGLMVFLSTTTLRTCWLGIMEEKAALSAWSDAQKIEPDWQSGLSVCYSWQGRIFY